MGILERAGVKSMGLPSDDTLMPPEDEKGKAKEEIDTPNSLMVPQQFENITRRTYRPKCDGRTGRFC